MQRSRRRRCGPLTRVGIGILAPALTLTIAAPAQAQGSSPRPDVASDWLAQTIAATGQPAQEGSVRRTWAIAWLSASRAVKAGYVPPGQRSRFEDAAVATAVHDVLVALVPGQEETLDDALEASLAAIPDGPGERAGKEAGQRAAARTLHEREDDGMGQAEPFTPPPPAPGVFQVPPDATTPGVGPSKARPFLLGAADRFRPGPPPAIGTDTYRRDLAEVQRVGAKFATEDQRSQAQTDIGLLLGWDQLRLYTTVLRPLVADAGRPVSWKVNLLAAFTTTTVDATMAVNDSKFAYLWWRPITAIREAGTDGDPLTEPDPTWLPLLPTPNHPEYTSAHTGYAGAAEQVLEHFTGRRTPVSFTLTRTMDTGRVITREYPRGTPWSVLTEDNIDARVYTGAHFRTSDEVGAQLGRRVAAYDLARLG